MSATLEQSRTQQLRAAAEHAPRGVSGGRRPAVARVLPAHRDRGSPRARAGGPARGRPGRARPRPPACRRHRQRRRDEPDRRVAGLVQRAHHRPGRHRRHAVPRRLGHRRARRARPHRPPRRAPAAGRPPRRGRHPAGDLRRRAGRGRVRRRHRVVDAPRGRPRRLGGGPRGDLREAAHHSRQRPRRRRGLEQDARSVQQHRGLAARRARPWGSRRTRSARRPGSSSGWPPTTSPSSATASTPSTWTTRARTCSPP